MFIIFVRGPLKDGDVCVCVCVCAIFVILRMKAYVSKIGTYLIESVYVCIGSFD